MSEMKIEADGRAANAEPAHEDAHDELFRAQRREGLVERQHQRAVEPGRGEQAQLGLLVGQPEDRVVRPQHLARVGLEGDRDRPAAERLRARDRRVDHGAVTAMHAVEIADRRHGAVELRDFRRIVADHDEVLGGRIHGMK